MPRPNISTAMLAALASPSVQLAFFVEPNFVSGPVYLWSGKGPLSWNAQTWQGVGQLGGITAIADSGQVEAKGLTLTLSGIDPTLLPLALGEFKLGLPVSVYLALFDAGVLIDNPLTSFAGRIDQPTIDISGETATIAINCESRLLDMNIAVDRRLTPEDQQRDWPGDLGLQFVPAIQEVTLYWGTAPTATTAV